MNTTRMLPKELAVRGAALILILSLLLGSALPAMAQSDDANLDALVGVILPGGADASTTPDGAILSSLRAGSIVTLLGRNADSSWLLVESGGAKGWVETGRVIVANLIGVPVTDEAAGAAASSEAVVIDTTPSETVIPETPAATLPVTPTLPSASASTAPLPSASTATGAEALASATASTSAAPVAPAASEAPAATETKFLFATVNTPASRLNLRATPGTAGALVAKVEDGTSIFATGRTVDGSWIAVTLADGVQGWASVAYLTLSGDPSSLPVVTQVTPQNASTSPVVGGSTDVAASSSAGSAVVAAAASTGGGASGSDAETAPVASAAAQTDTGLEGRLVFQDGIGTIYTYDLASGALATLTSGYDPAVSPDGSRVAFLRSGSEGGLFVIPIDGGGEETRIAGYRTGLSSPKWSPDGDSILFARGDDYIECYQMGSECLTELPVATGGPGMGSAMNADNLEKTRETTWHVTVVDADGSNLRDLPTTYTVATPDWGDQGVVYLSKEGIQITGDGDGATNRLVYKELNGPVTADADIQPYGSLVAYQVNRGGHWEIFTVNTDGSGATALTRPSTTLVDALPSNVSPAWSPDGSQIVFLSNRNSSGSAGPWHIWVMNADGSNQQMIPIDLLLQYSYGNEQMVDWGV